MSQPLVDLAMTVMSAFMQAPVAPACAAADVVCGRGVRAGAAVDGCRRVVDAAGGAFGA